MKVRRFSVAVVAVAVLAGGCGLAKTASPDPTGASQSAAVASGFDVNALDGDWAVPVGEPFRWADGLSVQVKPAAGSNPGAPNKFTVTLNNNSPQDVSTQDLAVSLFHGEHRSTAGWFVNDAPPLIVAPSESDSFVARFPEGFNVYLLSVERDGVTNPVFFQG